MADGDGERAFEARLERLFAEAPTFGDAEVFALRVSERLDRGWRLRGLAVGALGLTGGMVVVAQAAASGVMARLQSLPAHSTAAIGRAIGRVLPWRLSFSGLPFDAEAVWMPAVLAAVALGFAIVRAIREI